MRTVAPIQKQRLKEIDQIAGVAVKLGDKENQEETGGEKKQTDGERLISDWIDKVVIVEPKGRMSLLEEEIECKHEYFVCLKPWEKKDINGKRRVWINIYGVPLHGWSKETFTRVGRNAGKVIEVHTDTVERRDCRKGMVLLETPVSELIRKRSSILIHGEFFPVNLVE